MSNRLPNRQQPAKWSTSPYVASMWASVVETTGLDYWYKLPTARNFSITTHLKHTFQLVGALAMSAFSAYSVANWIQYRTYGISQPWNFFGSYLHTAALTTIGLISGWYFCYGLGQQLLIGAEDYHRYLSNKYIGSSYDF